jgi:hypothetical protein
VPPACAARGYATEAEVAEARSTKRVKVIQLKEFLELMKWGILMGVSGPSALVTL